MDRLLMNNYCQHILATKSAYIRGKIGEKLVSQMLTWQGYQVRQPDGRCQGDLSVVDLTTGETIKVEVKTARTNVLGRYQFCLKKNDKYGGTDCARSDVIVFLCVTKSGSHALFVIPSEICQQRQLTIFGNPHEYRGKWAGYRQYHNTLNLRTFVSFFGGDVATSRQKVYSGVAAVQ